MEIIDGRKISSEVVKGIKAEVKKLSFKPLFCDVLVGSNPVSVSYVRMKGKKAEKAGFGFKFAQYDENISQDELVSEINKLNKLENMCGLIVQLPLPPHLDKKPILDAIDPAVDVDCMGEVNSQKFYSGDIRLPPPTAAAIIYILDTLDIDLKDKNIVVVGRGELVGKPVTFLLKQRGLKVDIVTRSTPNTEELLAAADVLISATGKARLITGDKIKQGCIIIDAGTSESNGSIVGDVDNSSVSDKASLISPVPGGVGPVTVAMLLSNVLKVAKDKSKKLG